MSADTVARPLPDASAALVDARDAVTRWTAHLDALELAMTDGSGPAPRTDDLPPLPPELAERAQRALAAVEAAARDLAARRDAVAVELAELSAPRPRPSAPRPVYLDTVG